MNEQSGKGILGAITTAAGAVAAWLPMINTVVQIIAGIVAIAVGISTFRYYHRKNQQLK